MLNRISKLSFVVCVTVVLFLIVAFFFTFILRYNLMHSDVLSYWQESISWKNPFHEHPPLYPLSIALSRAITFNVFNPVVLMMAINLFAFVVCIICIYKISCNAGTNQTFAAFAALLFGLWPFVGLTFTVMPIADSPAFALTLAGLLSLQKSRRPLAAFLFALAIITHKGVWPIIGLITVADFYIRRELFSRRNLSFLVIMLLPLTILWIAGSFYHHSINWLMERSILVNTSIASRYPVLDGLFGSFQKGGFVGLLKGTVVLFLLFTCLGSLMISIKYKFKAYEYCIAIALGILIMLLFSSAQTIWGPVRYSKFLVIPIIIILNSLFKDKEIKRSTLSWSLILLFGLFLSQLGFAWYLTVLHLDNL